MTTETSDAVQDAVTRLDDALDDMGHGDGCVYWDDHCSCGLDHARSAADTLAGLAEKNQRSHDVLKDLVTRAFQGPYGGAWYICPKPEELAAIRAFLGMDDTETKGHK